MNLDEIIERLEELEKTEESEFISNCLKCLREVELASDISKTTREQILTEANKIVNGARNEAYGSPENNFRKIAALWSSYTGHDYSAHDVTIMMMLLKIARTSTGTGSMDNYVDIAGYAACAGEIYSKMWEEGE